MHNIYDCVVSFSSLLDTEYYMILGRKGVSVSLHITFDKKDCFHLMGLQYLTDRPQLNRDRGRIFDEIKERKITAEHVETSDFYQKISGRIDRVPDLEKYFDSNDTIFKYNEKKNSFSMIQAEYLMKNKTEFGNIFVFLGKNRDGKYFCRSFFPEEGKDYTKNQASWTLLYKEKRRISTGEREILYNRIA